MELAGAWVRLDHVLDVSGSDLEWSRGEDLCFYVQNLGGEVCAVVGCEVCWAHVVRWACSAWWKGDSGEG